MGTMIELENDLDLCQICGAVGMELCAEEDGQTAVSYTHLTLPTTPYV